ncbi:hypothetical protein BRE01_68330 [Brevibacillus reuszeri]|uniref:Uncharacterized protein n=1 Tax=Brevibacillus reuszeri TaxID=54915 RepID=A0A0K9YZV9_9BACL|nr:hypothetical protein ADS79_03240 [Brevibacillus reuszeri]GED73131.1 hypothetical protein BRE01_68330 [Brevibacillus reuszeri]
MHYILARILTPVVIEKVGDYTIMYDDIYHHSVWGEKHCLLENTTLDDSREFCKVRLNLIGKIVFVYNTYFL